MKSNSLWTRKYQSVVDNGQNHSMVMDLPEIKGGSNSGPTALEVCVMSFSGCVGTIFAMIAEKMRIKFSFLEVEVNAERLNDAPTITNVEVIINIKTEVDIEKLESCLDHTLNTCPVGLLFKQAGVEIKHYIKIIS